MGGVGNRPRLDGAGDGSFGCVWGVLGAAAIVSSKTWVSVMEGSRAGPGVVFVVVVGDPEWFRGLDRLRCLRRLGECLGLSCWGRLFCGRLGLGLVASASSCCCCCCCRRRLASSPWRKSSSSMLWAAVSWAVVVPYRSTVGSRGMDFIMGMREDCKGLAP